jgi:hypothetical protein
MIADTSRGGQAARNWNLCNEIAEWHMMSPSPGVTPDVAVSADDALTVAHLMALRKLMSRDGPPPWKEEVKSAIGQLEREIGDKAPAASK